MKTLVLVEHDGSDIKDATLAAVTAASQLGEVHLLVAGKGVGSVADAATKIAGVQKVHVADGAHLEHQLAEDVAPVAAKLMESHDAFLAPATTTGKNVAPRVAALLDVMQLSDILSVEGADTFTRPIYAGNAIATVKSKDSKKVITVRGTAFEKAARDGGSGSVEAVDAGYAPNDYQVGQTGKIVAPEVYIAIGISGAIQHLAGMKDSKTIIAINKDEEAPIFQVADVGLVGDLFKIVPELTEKL